VNEAGGLVGPRPVSNQKQAQREVETAVILRIIIYRRAPRVFRRR